MTYRLSLDGPQDGYQARPYARRDMAVRVGRELSRGASFWLQEGVYSAPGVFIAYGEPEEVVPGPDGQEGAET
jgi:hypothetical protein